MASFALPLPFGDLRLRLRVAMLCDLPMVTFLCSESREAALRSTGFPSPFESTCEPPYIRFAQLDSKGGDPVSHCHDLRLKGAATWIDASGEVRVA